jgi:CRP/FNR family transcriptional regulator, cyclic AMP receptor protein
MSAVVTSEMSRRELRHINLLRALSDGELRALEQRCRWQRYAAGQQILDRSSDNRDAFFVVEGSVRAVDFSPTGREVVYAVIGAGGHFGELSAIDGLARSASVVAIEDCLLAALPPTQFESLIRAQPEVAIGLLRDLVGIIRTTDERLTELATLGAIARVCRELLRLATADEHSGNWLIAPMPTQRDLAGRAGTTRETVARTLAQLSRDGLVRRSGRTLRIRDRAALEAASADLQRTA